MSDLDFNGRVTSAPLMFKFFPGRVIDQMPLLLEGAFDNKGDVIEVPRTPITPKRLLHERKYCRNEHDRDLLRNNYVVVALAVMDNPNKSGEVKLAHYSHPVIKDLVNSLNPESVLEYGALPINNDLYHAVNSQDSLIIIPNIANELCAAPYSNKSMRRAAWEFMAEGNIDLVDNNLKLVQNKVGGTFEDRMGLWLSNYKPGLRLVCVGSVGDGSFLAGCYDILYNDVGRLVGVAAEPFDARRASEKNVVPPKLEDAVNATYDYLSGLTGTQRPTKKGLRTALELIYNKNK